MSRKALSHAATIAAATVMLAAFAGAIPTAGAEARELRSSGAAPEASPWGQAMNAFAAKVGELSGGALTVKQFHGSQLGDEQTTIRQIARGRLDMGGFSNTASSLLVPEFGLLASPYAFADAAQADCVADNHLLTTFGPAFEAAGVHPIAWLEIGQQIIFAKEPIRTPADLAGVKIRTAPTKTDTMYIEAAGGSAVPLGTTDTMPALKTGNVSAVTWPTVYGIAVGYHEAAPHVTRTNHVHQIGTVIVSDRVWQNLSEQERGWLKTAAEELKVLRKTVRGAEAALLQKIAANGTEVIVPGAEEIAAWRAVAPQVQPQIVAELGGNSAEIWSAVEGARQACGG